MRFSILIPVFILSVLMIGLSGCGKKGDPTPLPNFTEAR
jgi:predicted small lipoprotein YifL